MALVHLALSQCADPSDPSAPSAGAGDVELPLPNSSCANLASVLSGPAGLAISWDGSNQGTSDITFPGATGTTSGHQSFTLGNTAAGDPHAKLTSNLTPAQVAAACTSSTGLPSLQLTSGTAKAPFDSPPVTVPATPFGVLGSPGDGQVSLSWGAPTSSGGYPITGYSATASPGGLTCTSTGATGCAVTGLTNGAPYTFTVTATNAVGTSAVSPPSLPITPASVTSAPTTVIAAGGNASALVSWTAPMNDGGAPVTGYTVTSSPGTKTCATGGATSCVVPGIANGTTYTFRVVATNTAGDSPPSAPSNPVTPSAVLPGNPTAVTATPEPAAALVAFSPPASSGGSPIQSYTVTASDSTVAAHGGETANGASSPILVSGLTPGDSYTFTVVATTEVGSGPASPASNPVVPTPLSPVGPRFLSGNHATFTQGTFVNNQFQVTAIGNPTPVLAASKSAGETGLPPGVHFAAATGVLSGVPTTRGTFTFNLTAANLFGRTTTVFTLDVVPSSPLYTSANSVTTTVGTGFTFPITTTGYPLPALSTITHLPAGVTLTDNHDGTATLGGTPGPGTGKIYLVQLTAKNVYGTTYQYFTLVVDQAPAITSANSATGKTGTAFSVTVKTTGYPAATLSASGLPSGVTLTNRGGGRATLAGHFLAGTKTFTLMATNGITPNATQIFHLTGT
jgi:Fibronectin type III domain/Putative Ig domain